LRNPERLQNGRKFQKRQLWLDTIPDWSPHDLRRTVRTGLSRIQCPSEVAEAAIGHGKKGIEGTYNLHEYEAECRIWLQRWADHIGGLRDGN
jgi:integrase